MARYLHPLPRCEAGIDLLPGRFDPLFRLGDFIGEIEVGFERLLMKLFETLFQLPQRFLEFQRVGGLAMRAG